MRVFRRAISEDDEKVSAFIPPRRVMWPLFLGVRLSDIDSYLALVHRGPSSAAAKIDTDIGRTLQGEINLEAQAPPAARKRLLNAYVHLCEAQEQQRHVGGTGKGHDVNGRGGGTGNAQSLSAPAAPLTSGSAATWAPKARKRKRPGLSSPSVAAPHQPQLHGAHAGLTGAPPRAELTGLATPHTAAAAPAGADSSRASPARESGGRQRQRSGVDEGEGAASTPRDPL